MAIVNTMNEAVISLCDLTGNMVRPWADAGYECWAIDIQHSIRVPRTERVGAGVIHYVWGDVRSFRRPTTKPIVFGMAQTPCTDVAGSGARDFATKGGMLLNDGIVLFVAARQILSWTGAPYFQENSVGVLSSLPHIGRPDHYFDPYQFSNFALEDWYTKKTCLWGGNGFEMPQHNYDRARYERGLAQMAEKKRLKDKNYPTPDYPDNRIHFASPSDDRGNVRSAAPMGFARAVFQANSPAALMRVAS